MSFILTNFELFWPAFGTATVLALSAVLYLTKKLFWPFSYSSDTLIIKHPFDVSKQSRIIPGPERIRVSIFAENDKDFLVNSGPNVTTLYENFLCGLKRSNNGECLGHRTGERGEYQFIRYQEALDRAHHFGSGLLELGLKPGENNYVGIYSQNRAEWNIASLGCMSYSLAIIPLYDSLGAEAVSFIVNQADIEVIVCDNVIKAKKLLENASNMPSLKHLVVMDCPPEITTNGLATLVAEKRVKIHSFKDLSATGQQNPKPLRLPTPDDLYIICYTSGTTGTPKGVMISHENMMCQVACARLIFNIYGIDLKVNDAVISYLPMAHMFEQLSNALVFTYGAKLGYFQGNINSLMSDMKALHPACFPVVPRLLNKLYDKVQSNLSGGGLKKWLFDYAFQCKLAEMRNGIVRNDSIWDKLVFSKIQKELGGNLRIMVTGSAPIAEEVLTLSRVMLGAFIAEGYGQTEATAAVTLTLPGDMNAGHVGGPLPCAHIKLVDAPELEYFAKNDQGEICIRGPCITRGYFKEPEKTKEILDEDGWLHTGDIGMWLPDGTLKVVDRKKHIFKLAQGEYVAPEKIENIYLRSPYVAQIFVDGKSLQRYLVAIVVPEESALKKWAVEKNLSHLTYPELCNNSDVKAMLLNELHQIGKQNKLNSLEQVRAIHVSSEHFTMENGLLTPTMKSKRPVLRKRYTSRVDELYKNISD